MNKRLREGYARAMRGASSSSSTGGAARERSREERAAYSCCAAQLSACVERKNHLAQQRDDNNGPLAAPSVQMAPVGVEASNSHKPQPAATQAQRSGERLLHAASASADHKSGASAALGLPELAGW